MKLIDFASNFLIFWEKLKLSFYYVAAIAVMYYSVIIIFTIVFSILGLLLGWEDVIRTFDKYGENAETLIGLMISAFPFFLYALYRAYSYLKGRQTLRESFYIREIARAQESNYIPFYDNFATQIKNRQLEYNLYNHEYAAQKENILARAYRLMANMEKPS